MKIYSCFFLISALFLYSCTSVPAKSEESEENIDFEAEENLESPSEKEPEKSDEGKLLSLKDIYISEELTLAEKTAKKPVFAFFSASWCDSCHEMRHVAEVLHEKFGNRVQFFELTFASDNMESETDYDYFLSRESVIQMDEKTVTLEDIKVLPRVFIFNSSGTVAADIEGIYPSFYYYTVIARIFNTY
ncbi:MAG: hypothetical protein R6W70_00125 [bacterium]